MSLGSRLSKLANHQRLFRRLVLVWACMLITWVVVRTWIDPPDISPGTAGALATVVGILATVVGFYQWHRKADDERRREK